MIISVKKNSKQESNQRKTDQFLVKYAHKIGHFFTNCFSAKVASKMSVKFLWNQVIFHTSVSENPAKSDFFSATYQKPWKKLLFN